MFSCVFSRTVFATFILASALGVMASPLAINDPVLQSRTLNERWTVKFLCTRGVPPQLVIADTYSFGADPKEGAVLQTRLSLGLDHSKLKDFGITMISFGQPSHNRPSTMMSWQEVQQRLQKSELLVRERDDDYVLNALQCLENSELALVTEDQKGKVKEWLEHCQT